MQEDRRRFIGWAALGAAGCLPGAAMSAASSSAPLREQEQVLSSVITKPFALRYLLWTPAPATKPAAGWPLVIFMHGSGERGEDLAEVKTNGPPMYAAQGRQFPFVLVAPQLPEHRRWDVDEIELLRADLVKRLPIDPDRVLVTGLSLGGHGAWDYAAEYPDRVAAIAPVCGMGDIRRARRVARVPVWAFHGALDDQVPIAGDQAMVNAVRALGGNVRFTIYPEVGHNAWDTAYADAALYDWLMAQHRAPPPAA